ncbi:MAG: response regulator transcription factor [Haliscomenobacter sp.]|nr:response regulator transcription factor [Haliscomenobacter sp.]MBK9490244.1 response regulator transcription factor [Haliscomenobacter sp.]
MYNIAIIEDDLVLRKGLSDYFSQSKLVDCVLAVDTVEKFAKYHRDFLEIKLILLDVMLYGQSSILSIPLILQREPNAEIVIFTIIEDSETIFQALCNGATGYLLKTTNFEQLEEQIVANLSGEGALVSPAVAKKIIKYFAPQAPEQSVNEQDAGLSEKEGIIVKLLRDGSSYQEIANFLGISLNGVRYHVKNVYRKLHIKSRGGLLKKNR